MVILPADSGIMRLKPVVSFLTIIHVLFIYLFKFKPDQAGSSVIDLKRKVEDIEKVKSKLPVQRVMIDDPTQLKRIKNLSQPTVWFLCIAIHCVDTPL